MGNGFKTKKFLIFDYFYLTLNFTFLISCHNCLSDTLTLQTIPCETSLTAIPFQWEGKGSDLILYLISFVCMLHLEAEARVAHFKCEVINFF